MRNLFVAGAMLYSLFSTAAQAASAGCDRACLHGFADQYVAALVAHDPNRLPFAKNVRFTENGQVMELGDGFWATVSGDGAKASKIYFSETAAGQVGYFGAMEEAGNPVILYLRLKVTGRQITEVETLISRKETPEFYKPLELKNKAVFEDVLPPAQRRSRTQMIDTIRAYFEAQIQAKYNDAIFSPACQRIENGVITASNPNADKMGKLSCGDQIKTGVSALLTREREARFFVVDEERGLIGTIFLFDHDGSKQSVNLTFADGTTAERKSSSGSPFSWLAGELFKIRDGKIEQIEIVIVKTPYRMPSGWPAAQ
ncbi:MAG: hypothetical protein ABI859_00340 [Pseudomonadota bacterium]